MHKEKKPHANGDNNTENGNLKCSFLAWFSPLKAALSSTEGSRALMTEHKQENEQEGDCCGENNTRTQEEENKKKTTKKERDKERVFPDAFYCPITGEIMKDPVVHPNGTLFEQSAVVATIDTEVVCYTNRALQAIIQHEQLRCNALALQRKALALQQIIDELVGVVSTCLLPSPQEFDPLPEQLNPLLEQYYCPITLDIMRNPVIGPNGHTFDRRALVNWMKESGQNSPVSRKLKTIKQLYKNTAIMDLLEEEASRDNESMHPCIRQWKEQTEREGDEDDKADLEEGDFSFGGRSKPRQEVDAPLYPSVEGSNKNRINKVEELLSGLEFI